jgi:hypothetical protein
MRRQLILNLALLLAALTVPGTVSAAAVEQGCRSHTWEPEAGKTPLGFFASATDGCNTVRWNSTVGAAPGAGTLTFRTVGHVQPTEPGYSLPGPQGGNYCQYRAAHEANLYFTNLFGMPPGTEVTVSYRCD